MDNVCEKFNNCTDPEEYVSLMFENTDKGTGMLCFPGLWHGLDDDNVYRFHMNWNQNDVNKLKEDHKSLVESLTALSKIDSELTEDNAASIIKDEKLMGVWNTYVRPFTGDAEFTDEISDILNKAEDGDPELTEAEEEILDKYCDARAEQAEKRVGKSRFALSLIICAQRLHKLLSMRSPQIVIKNESRELITAMALHRYCDSQEGRREICK